MGDRLSNEELITAIQIKLCRFLISNKKASDAKDIALKLHQNDPNNAKYQAMLICAAIHSSPADMDLAKQICAKMEIGKAGMDEFALNECLENIPKDENERVFDFEIDEEMETRKKRQANQRKRGKIGNKLRAKYKDNPSLFKEPIDWKTDKNEKRAKEQKEKEEKPHENEKKNLKKKTKAFR